MLLQHGISEFLCSRARVGYDRKIEGGARCPNCVVPSRRPRVDSPHASPAFDPLQTCDAHAMRVRMLLSALRIRAMDGAALVEGTLTIRSDDPAVRSLLPPENGIVAIKLPSERYRKPSFDLLDRVEQGPHGLYNARRPALRVSFEDAFPDLPSLLPQAGREDIRLKLEADGGRIGSFMIQRPEPDGNWSRGVWGHLRDLTLQLRQGEDNVRIVFDGAVRPFTLGSDNHSVSNARLVGDILLPHAYFAVAQIYIPRRTPASAAIEWDASTSGMGALAVSEWDQSFFPGMVDWGQTAKDLIPTGPFVDARVKEHEMVARPVKSLKRSATGFAVGFATTDGPELVLPIGYADWTRSSGIQR